MPLLRTLSRVSKLSCNAKFPSHITSVPPFTRFSPVTHVQSYASSALAKKTSSNHRSRVPTDASDLPTNTVNEREVFIQWDGTTRSKFHHIWLRDHCRCPECFHSITKQRLISTFEIPPDLEPISTRSTSDGLEVVWPASTGTHVSTYPWSWLRAINHSPSINRESAEKVLWGSKIAKEPPLVPYDQVVSSEYGTYKWLSKIDTLGFCFVSGVPATPEATEQLANRIAFIRETHYGKFWDFTSDLARGDTAYSNMALAAHTDNTYFTDPCGVQIFHLLEHTGGSGGASLLVDGFYVASILRDLYPDAYELLSTVPIPSHAAGESGILYRAAHPPLKHDAAGNLRAVRWNNDDRSALRNVPHADVPRLYEAMRTWNKLITSQDSEYWVQLSPGTVIAFDNHRVLHGRSSFTGKRRMCGAYIGVDEFRSRLAVLSERFSSDSSPVRNSDATTEPRKRTVWSHDF
ncbi:hypothetical protein V8E52_004215 [Russula decolorans]